MEKAQRNQQESCRRTLGKPTTKPINSRMNLKEQTMSHRKKCKIHSIKPKKSALTINSQKQSTEQEKEGKGVNKTGELRR